MGIPRGWRERWPPGLTTPAGSRPASAFLSGWGSKASRERCPRTAHLGDAGAHQPAADDRHVLDEDFLR